MNKKSQNQFRNKSFGCNMEFINKISNFNLDFKREMNLFTCDH